MEFTKQQGFLGFLQFLLRIGKESSEGRLGQHFFHGRKRSFRLPVLLLHPDLRGIAAYRPGIQIPFHSRLFSACRLRGFTSLRKISLRRGMNQIPFAGALLQRLQFLQIHPGRTAAVVSHTPEHTACQRLLFFRLPVLGIHPFFHLFTGFSHKVSVCIRSVGHDFGAVEAHPDEIIRRQGAVPLSRTAEKIGVKPGFCHELYQPPAVSEGVKINGGCGLFPEFFPEIFPSGFHLPDKGLSAWHIAVGLQIPAAHDMPLSFPYQLLNPGKKLRFHLFDPFVNHHFIMVEYKAVIFLAEYGCHTKGGNGG